MLTWLRRHCGLLVAVTLLLVAARSHAAPQRIGAGREAEVLALLAPYRLAEPVRGQWLLWDVQIGEDEIVVRLKGPAEERLELQLVPRSRASGPPPPSASFGFVLGAAASAEANEARDRLVQAVRRNDSGAFWRSTPNVPGGPALGAQAPRVTRWLFDGALLSGGLLLLILGLCAVHLWRAPGWVRLLVPLATAVGAGLRWWLSPATFLGAWPWSRLYPNVRLLYESPLLAGQLERLGRSVTLIDLTFGINYLYAVLLVPVLFMHGTQLLRDVRAGALAAAMVALLPHHLRFSRCEDGFIPSLLFSSLSFSLLHTWLREPSRALRWTALLVWPPVLYAAYLARPLNLIYVLVYLGAVLGLHAREASVGRRAVALLVVGAVGGLATLDFVTQEREAITQVGAQLAGLLPSLLTVFVSPTRNTFLHAEAFPPELLLLGGLGALAWWRRGERRLPTFLLLWAGLFMVSHAIVSATHMQPRYHLQSLVPLLLLASGGAVWLLERRRAALAVAALGLAAAPLVSLPWITDVHYAELQELDFLRQAEQLIPEGCRVVEYRGELSAHEARLPRLGERVPAHGERFHAVALAAPEPGADLDALARGALQAGGHCVYLYEGLPCGAPGDAGAVAPLCRALTAAAPLETAAELRVERDFYDDQWLHLVGEGPPLRLRLSRVVEPP